MHYSNSNYEAFVRPRKPAHVDEKSAHIVGAGLAGLSAAAFLVRDGQMDGSRITVYESMPLPGAPATVFWIRQRDSLSEVVGR